MARSYREDRLARARRGGNDDTSAARVLLSMVALVAILLLGNLFWTALTSLASAVGSISAQLPQDPLARASPTVSFAVAPAPTTAATLEADLAPAPTAGSPTAGPTPEPVVPEQTLTPPAPPTAAPTALSASETPTAAGGRAPWVLLPQPEPGARVPRGTIVVAARGRGDAPIADIRLELDGAALHAEIEQRSDSVWLARAATSVAIGPHVARAVVTDVSGRVGAYRWSFSGVNERP
ncbi:MAG: hypothetical protein JO023_10385 [Chloroflexi bacterium]|nr:hypothetical protein [Chloroflexota bacterium]